MSMPKWIAIVIGAIIVGMLVGGGIYWSRRDADDKAEDTRQATDTTVAPVSTSTRLQGTKLANYTPQAEVKQLQAIDLVEGKGEVVPAHATITAHYTGAVAATGIIFQSSHDIGQAITFKLISPKDSPDGRGVIDGWVKGVSGMKVGGTRRLIIPADLAYGQNPPANSGIPADAALVFDIELVSMP